MPQGCEQSTGPDCMGKFIVFLAKKTVYRHCFMDCNWKWHSILTNYLCDRPTRHLHYEQGNLRERWLLTRLGDGKFAFLKSLTCLKGDDTVFVCTMNSTGHGAVFINWNDQHSSERMYEVSFCNTRKWFLLHFNVGILKFRPAS